MGRWGWIAVFVAAAGLGAPAARAEPPSLAGVNRFDAAGAGGAATVVLPTDVVVPCEFYQPERAVRLHHDGSFAALVFESLDTGSTFEFVDLPDGAYHDSLGPICGPVPKTVTMPAGRYRVALLTDGAAVGATVTLGELGGEAVHAADEEIAFKAFAAVDPTPGGAGVFLAETTGTVEANGLLYATVWAEGLALAAESGACIREDERPVPAPTWIAYCARTHETRSSGTTLTSIDDGVPAGGYMLGGYSARTGVTSSQGLVAFVLEKAADSPWTRLWRT